MTENEKKTLKLFQTGYLRPVQRDFASVEEAIDFLAEPRLWVGSKPESAPSGQIELFSSKQKGNAVVYRYFNRMESHRGTGSRHDPDFYEQNDSWEEEFRNQGMPEDKWKFWAWTDNQGMGWQMVRWGEYQAARGYVETNEWGEVSP